MTTYVTLDHKISLISSTGTFVVVAKKTLYGSKIDCFMQQKTL